MIYTKTTQGQAAFQARSVSLLPKQRSAFILFDGKRSEDEVLRATAGLGVTPDDVKQMVALGLIEARLVATLLDSSSMPVATEVTSLNEQELYLRSYLIATRLTATLGLRGFRLNLAVEAAGNLNALRQLAPKIEAAIGPEKFKELEAALYF